MPAIGIGMLWSAYTLAFWGWTLVKGYDISLMAIALPGQWKGTWPPGKMSDTQVLGGGSSAPTAGPSTAGPQQAPATTPGTGGTIAPSGGGALTGGGGIPRSGGGKFTQ